MPSPTTEEVKKTVEEYIASLSPKDRIIHDLAAKMLKTRYDPKRTNGYQQFLKK